MKRFQLGHDLYLRTTGASGKQRGNASSGFSLIEVVIALVIIMVALLGAFSVLTFAITYNAGNKARAQAAAVMQQEIERYRSAKFNSTKTDDYENPEEPDLCLSSGLRDLRGRAERKCRVIAHGGGGLTFTVTSTVDNDPLIPGIQDESWVCLSPQGENISCAIKEITIEVKLAAPCPGWQTAIPTTAIFRRVRGN